jgi:hypothetical protein
MECLRVLVSLRGVDVWDTHGLVCCFGCFRCVLFLLCLGLRARSSLLLLAWRHSLAAHVDGGTQRPPLCRGASLKFRCKLGSDHVSVCDRLLRVVCVPWCVCVCVCVCVPVPPVVGVFCCGPCVFPSSSAWSRLLLVESFGFRLPFSDDLPSEPTQTRPELVLEGPKGTLLRLQVKGPVGCSLVPLCLAVTAMDRYKEIRRIGKGSFGTVFLCENLETKARVVVKKIGELLVVSGAVRCCRGRRMSVNIDYICVRADTFRDSLCDRVQRLMRCPLLKRSRHCKRSVC